MTALLELVTLPVSDAFGDCAYRNPEAKNNASTPARAKVLRMSYSSSSRIGLFVYMYEPTRRTVPDRADCYSNWNRSVTALAMRGARERVTDGLLPCAMSQRERAFPSVCGCRR